MHIIQNSKDNAEIIQKSNAYFDSLYKDVKREQQIRHNSHTK
ncbi:MAG: hypothetical protein ACC630_07750 [Nitrospinota bacterium]